LKVSYAFADSIKQIHPIAGAAKWYQANKTLVDGWFN